MSQSGMPWKAAAVRGTEFRVLHPASNVGRKRAQGTVLRVHLLSPSGRPRELCQDQVPHFLYSSFSHFNSWGVK